MEVMFYSPRESKQYAAHLCYKLGIKYTIAKKIAENSTAMQSLFDAYRSGDEADYDDAWNNLKEIDGIGPKRSTLYLEKYFEDPYRSINWEMFNILQKYQQVIGWTENRMYDLARRIDDPSKIWLVYLNDESITLPIAIEIYKMTTKDEPYLQSQTIQYFTQYTDLKASQFQHNNLTSPKFLFNKDLNEQYKLFMEIEDVVMLRETAEDYVTILKFMRENKNETLELSLNDIDISDFGEDQVLAFEKLKNKRVMLLTGYAGTGKTYMLDKYISALAGHRIYACALAGKAVKNFVDAMSVESMRKINQSTIAGLRYVPTYKDYFSKSSVVIVDEASMISMSDLAYIIRLMNEDTKLILIGDINQLPAIQLDVLNWLVSDNELEKVTLDIPKRQAADSGIFKDSMSIINKEIPAFDSEESQAHIGQTYVQQIIAENMDADIFLTTTNQVKDTINNIKAEEVRQIPNHAVFQNKIYKETVDFHEGYQIMIGKNNVDTGLMNGDIFVINYEGHLVDPYTLEAAKDLDGKILKIGENRDYPDAGFGGNTKILDTTAHNVQMAFAITAHKSQGSTMNKGVTVMGPGPLATRNLLYTAITRFKEKHVLYLPDQTLLEQILQTGVQYQKLSKDEQDILIKKVEQENEKQEEENE